MPQIVRTDNLWPRFMKDFLKKFTEACDEICEGIGKLESLITYESLYRKIYRSGMDSNYTYKGFRNLQKRGIIKKHGKSFKFSRAGKEWFTKSQIKYFSLKTKKWDKKWRVIIFDIPEELHSARNSLRRKLKEFGFYTLQKSVFIFPYPCEEELGDLCSKIGVSDYVDILVAESVGFKKKEIYEYFSL